MKLCIRSILKKSHAKEPYRYMALWAKEPWRCVVSDVGVYQIRCDAFSFDIIHSHIHLVPTAKEPYHYRALGAKEP